jgi:aminoglycoside phosphotransferase (APT) family kinase protein
MDKVARSLARFVAALQATDSAGGVVHEFRGLALSAHVGNAEDAAAVLAHSLDIRPALTLLERIVAAPAWLGRPVWTHGDLHPANLLTDRRELSAVIDFGLLGVGDPACDLMVAWTYLSPGPREVFRGVLAVDDATWLRGRGWALQFGLRAAAYSADNPVLDQIGLRTLVEIQKEQVLSLARLHEL